MNIRLDTREFNRSLRAYAKVSERSLADILNKKAHFIARRAYFETTPRGDKQRVVSAMQQEARIAPVPLVAILANKWAKQKYGKGFKGGDSKQFVSRLRTRNGRLVKRRTETEGQVLEGLMRRITGARKAAVTFARAGWIPAIRIFGAKTGKAFGAALEGKFKNLFKIGGAKAATPGKRPVAELWSAALSRKTAPENTHKVLGKALQQAINAETVSMNKEVERRMQSEADKIARTILR